MKGQEWRAFRHNTEAGRLLARLYGVDNSNNTKPKISYPELHVKKEKQKTKPLHHDVQWRSVGAPKTRDPTETRYDRAKAASVPLPKFGRNKSDSTLPSAVDRIPHRRSQQSCSNELASRTENRGAYRPPRHAFCSETEKEKLSEINAYRGGKILPTDLTHPVATLPSEIQKRQREADRLRLAKDKRRSRMGVAVGGINGIHDSVDSTDIRPQSPTLFDQILNEINDRRQWQSEMEAIGAGEKTRQKTVEEISARVKELHRIDKARAQLVLKEKDR